MPIKVLSSQLLTRIIGAKSTSSDIILYLNESSGTSTGWGDMSIYSNGASFTGNVIFDKGLVSPGTVNNYAQGFLTLTPGDNFTISATIEPLGDGIQIGGAVTIFASNIAPLNGGGFLMGYYDNTSSLLNRNSLFFAINDNTFIKTNYKVTYNTKVTFTVTYDGSVFKLFVNGILDTSLNNVKNFIYPANKVFRVGYYNSSGGFERAFNGKIYNVVLYNRTLSDGEIATLYFKSPNDSNVITQTRSLQVSSDRVIYVDASEPRSFYSPSVTFFDLSGNGRNGTLSRKLVSGTLPAFNQFNGGYFSFRGFAGNGAVGSSYVAFASTALLPLVNTPSTITTWVRLRSYTAATAQYRYIFSYGTTQVNGARWIGVSLENTTATFMTGLDINRQVGSFVTASNFTTNEWFQVSQVYSSGSLSLYVNGALRVQKTGLSSNVPNSAVTPRIGMNCTQPTTGAELTADGFFNGDIAQVTVYNRALTPEEIWQNYKVTRHKFRAPDVGVPTPGSGGPTVPTVLTNDAVQDIFSATTGLQVISIGSGPVTRQGILWRQNSGIIQDVPNSQAITNWPDGKSFDQNNPNSTTFNTTMSPLGANTRYYYVAFAENSAGIGWGEEKTFQTLNTGVPTVTADSSTILNATDVRLFGRVLSNGGNQITRRGFVYSPFIITSTNQIDSLVSAGQFVDEIDFDIEPYNLPVTGLNPNTTYYFESFANNNLGRGYSINSNKSFTTPAFATISIVQSSVTSTQIVILVTTTGQNITNQGVVWNTTGNPTLANQLTDIGMGVKTNAPTQMNSLTAGQTYYIRGYVKNDPGGNVNYTPTDLVITTSNVPTVLMESAGPPLDVSSPVAGNITSDGGQTITEKGFLASDTTLEPILTTSGVKKVSNTINATGLYFLTITGLIKNTTYYVRAYANNASGTGYSQDIFSILTLTEPNPLTTDPPPSVTSNTATLGGLLPIEGLGNDLSASVGFEYGLVSTPLNITTTQVFASFEGGSFQLPISGLTPGTNYRYRAYATNSALTGFGEWVTFATTGNVPQFTLASLTSTGLQFSAQVTIQSDGGVAITQKGIVWSTSPNPVVTLSTKTQRGAGSSGFTDNITTVTQNTLYYVRAYVVTYDTFYTIQQTITIDTSPALTIGTPTAVTNTTMNVAVSGITDGGDPITSRGVVIGTSTNPTTATNVQNIQANPVNGTTNFSISISGLSANTQYFIRAYATNLVTTAYSNQVTATTTNNVLIITRPVTTFDSVTALLGGEVTFKGSNTISARGIVYSTSQNPTGPTRLIDNTNNTGVFELQFSGLTPNTVYYVRAYVTTQSGTFFGTQQTFTTNALTPPSVSIGTPTKSGLSFTVTVIVSGDLITANGLVWADAATLGASLPTTTNSTVVNFGSVIGTQNITINTGLSPLTQYVMRGFATNLNGTVYAPQFGTESILLSNVPSVTLTNITSTNVTANVNCNVTDDGGETLTERGVIYRQTTATTLIVIGAGTTKFPVSGTTGVYTANLSGLTPGATYQVRAYAINAMGTAYSSSQLTLVMDDLPVVTTTAFLYTDHNIGTFPQGQTRTSFVARGVVVNDGGSTITETGIVWNTSNVLTGLTIASSLKISGTTLGNFAYSTKIGGNDALLLDQQYFYRAYATNAYGTSYGAVQTMTTLFIPTVIVINPLGASYPSGQVTLSGRVDPAFFGNSELYSQPLEVGFYYESIPNATTLTRTVVDTNYTITDANAASPNNEFTLTVNLTTAGDYVIRPFAKNRMNLEGTVSRNITITSGPVITTFQRRTIIQSLANTFQSEPVSSSSVNLNDGVVFFDIAANDGGGADMTEFGIVSSSTNTSPTTLDVKNSVSLGTGTNGFSLLSQIGYISSGEPWYFRGYVKQGTNAPIYSTNVVSISLPFVSLTATFDSINNTITCNLTVTTFAGQSLVSKGIRYNDTGSNDAAYYTGTDRVFSPLSQTQIVLSNLNSDNVPNQQQPINKHIIGGWAVISWNGIQYKTWTRNEVTIF